jgi:6-pyruvoyltetrahydropterin/6-carboxytetrahydropterin synthase
MSRVDPSDEAVSPKQAPVALAVVETSFEAAHFLSWHPGACQRLHGHHYRLEVALAGPLDERGVVVDFDEVADVLEAVVRERFDHRLLNDLVENPTAERLASQLWSDLAPLVPAELARLRLWETPGASVELVGQILIGQGR